MKSLTLFYLFKKGVIYLKNDEGASIYLDCFKHNNWLSEHLSKEKSELSTKQSVLKVFEDKGDDSLFLDRAMAKILNLKSKDENIISLNRQFRVGPKITLRNFGKTVPVANVVNTKACILS